MNRFLTWISEQFDAGWTGLRSTWRTLATTFWPDRSAYDKTIINFELARQLYRNDGQESRLGAGFCKPIIDRSVEFMGMPIFASDDEDRDLEINNAVQRYWRASLIEVFRNAMRDSKTVVRVWQPRIDNPLVTDEERRFCSLEVLDPKKVKIFYSADDPDWIEQAVVVNFIEFPDQVDPSTDAPRGTVAKVKEHEVWELVTPKRHRYYDRTDRVWLNDWAQDNPYGFVPILEVFNEWDSTLSSGQSDFESVYPFVKAFHEVFLQALQAHKYHSTPKAVFKVTDVLNFLKNNFPNVIDPETGDPLPQSTINWQGREILFVGKDDDIQFLEAKSVLGDTKTLLEFLVDCIAVASEMPEEMFMRTAVGETSSSDRKFQAFERKIERKRGLFMPYIARIAKMARVMNGNTAEVGEILWDEIQVESLATMSQALQQISMTFEVLLSKRLISDNTARETLRAFRIFRRMKPPAQEARDAQDNFDLDAHLAELKPPAPSPNGGQPRPAITGRPVGGRNE
jgi:hypothetical protein